MLTPGRITVLLLLGAALLVVYVEMSPPRERATANREQIAAACHALHAPDPATTADCTARPVVFERLLLNACLDHLPARAGAPADAYGNCLGRVRRHTRSWRLAPGPLEAWIRRTFPDPQEHPWAYPPGR